MFNLVVLCTLVAAAAAGGIVPLTYSAALFPATTTISRQASSVIHPTPLISTPLVYSSPLYAHLIKKRSAVFAPSFIAPSTYITRAPLVTGYAAPLATTYSVAAPLTTAIASPFYGAHFIKKRSVAAVYAAPAAVSHQSRVDIKSTPAVAYTSYSAPLTYAAAPVFSTPIVSAARFVSAAPIAYSHLIKKRSLAVTAYVAPSAVSHQSRVDFKSNPAIETTYTSYAAPLTYAAPAVSYAAPISYSSPLISHLY
ncbi:cuticle protein 16.5-like [Aricia agestis]|uniref:cuticle protein 16.5-like n=1 Tax=Aricia agestis TaxID=91739 RepID=UPI001C208C55|nr:cuticle protein 16.5-like [Aricia agestis]